MLKGLLLKDIYCVRFIALVGLMISSIPAIGLVIAAGTDSAAGDIVDNIISVVPYVLCDILIIMLNSSFMLNTLGEDYNSGWARLQHTLPVSSRKIVDAKLIATLIIVGALTLISLAVNVILGIGNGQPLEIMLAAPLVTAMLEICTLFPAFPISMKLSGSLTSFIYIALEIAVIAAATIALTVALDHNAPLWLLRVVFYAIIPAVTVTTALLSRHFALKYISAEE